MRFCLAMFIRQRSPRRNMVDKKRRKRSKRRASKAQVRKPIGLTLHSVGHLYQDYGFTASETNLLIEHNGACAAAEQSSRKQLPASISASTKPLKTWKRSKKKHSKTMNTMMMKWTTQRDLTPMTGNYSGKFVKWGLTD